LPDGSSKTFTGLLQELGVDEKDSPGLGETRGGDGVEEESSSALLNEVLAEMPSTSREDSIMQVGVPSPVRSQQVEIEEDPLTMVDFDRMAEAERLLQAPASLDMSRSEITDMLQGTLKRDDLSGMLASLDARKAANVDTALVSEAMEAEAAAEEAAAAAEAAAAKEAAEAAEAEAALEAAKVAEAASAAEAARLAEEAEQEAQRQAVEEAERKAQEEADRAREAEERAATEKSEAEAAAKAHAAALAVAEEAKLARELAAMTAADEEAMQIARIEAQDALSAAIRQRNRLEVEACLVKASLVRAEACRVDQKQADLAKQVIAELLEEEASAAKRAAEKAHATEQLLAAVQQRSRPELEQRFVEARDKKVDAHHLAQAQQVIEELHNEEAVARARKAAELALADAMQQRSQDMLLQAIHDAKENDVQQETIDTAERVLHEVIDEENCLRAAHALSHACEVEDIEELNLAIEHAIQKGVEQNPIDGAVAKLKYIRRRRAAAQQLREAFDPKSTETLEVQIHRLREALQEARDAGVPRADMQELSERLASMVVILRRANALKAMNEALAAEDIERIQASLGEARKAGVEEIDVARVERALQDLIDEIELAHEKQRLLRLRIENSMAAKNSAECATTSKEVEHMLGEHSVTKSLRNTIEEARKLRFVNRGEISKAEAVLNEVTADLKRILVEKRMQEQRQAERKLGVECDTARAADPTTQPVLDGLEKAITAAKVYNASCRDAEALLTTLRTNYQRATLLAREFWDRSVSTSPFGGRHCSCHAANTQHSF